MSPEKYVASPVWFGYSGVPIGKPPQQRCIIVDLDNSLLNNDHRQHYMAGETKQWGPFFNAMGEDDVYPEIKFILDLIFNHTDVSIILVTGRPSQYHALTLTNLHDLGVNFTSLIMRAQTDNRADHDVKLDMLEGIKRMGFIPMFCIDDRPEVVAMWREQGIRTLQCDPSMWYKEDQGALNARVLLDENERLRARVIELELAVTCSG
jgi:hypothetical protein